MEKPKKIIQIQAYDADGVLLDTKANIIGDGAKKIKIDLAGLSPAKSFLLGGEKEVQGYYVAARLVRNEKGGATIEFDVISSDDPKYTIKQLKGKKP